MKWLKQLASLMILLSSNSFAKDLVQITSGSWEPFTGENLPEKGVFCHIVKLAFERAGIKVYFEFYPWVRAFHYGETGKRHGTIPWKSTAERAEKFYISQPIISYSYHFYHMKNQPIEWESYQDLKSYIIGATKGYNYGQTFQQAEKDGVLQVTRLVKNSSDFIRLIFNQRIQLFLGNRHVMEYTLNHYFNQEERARITFHSKAIDQDELHILLSKNHPQNQRRIALVDQQIQLMREKGEIQALIQQALENRQKDTLGSQ
ncbi:substrate-binding periplasmic protein [Algicola sagamiensis]|uniref:substrate-binding periplasmic protein n=1 Tax=Algicola sagamiensis TaxID=163869 RepID=UPI0003672BD3|nr:transporter substrate-binding domain-containing protein [Algicola sagamiensis]